MQFDLPRSGVVHMRISPAEKRGFYEAARKRGLTLSEFLRESAADAIRRAL